jgi:hypothetical protein
MRPLPKEARRPVAAINAEIKLTRVVLFLIVVMCLQPFRLAHSDQVDSVWIETKWPFLMDQWGEGRSFQCKAADCGAEINLYIRAKIGFCSTTTGVSDDDELERLSDFDFMEGHSTALASGREINIAGMKGRLRQYATAGSIFSKPYAFSVAFNSNSDALVATVRMKGGSPGAAEQAIIKFLNGKTIQRWISHTLGL